ncbi:helix-turn-helix domain-containing protein [Xanthovirga aplysinae]|uniref:helix-turn-helix domain-containing protein n=1 Tax=Xanthovirga aplysinae TaxID=2529853 RepID=UPI0012BCC002|nr:helix-turn-helix domain-containing protein [Xanthovirga aplysinae]MTI31187.1 AraC family transcriptional regulator [Xanthovirga aplysinae]
MKILFLELFALIAILHSFVLGLVLLLSKFFKKSTNNYLGFTLLIMAIVGLNNWFWDIGMNPILVNVLDLFLWQFLYPVTYFMFFYKTSDVPPIKAKKLRTLLLPFLALSLLNIFVSLSTKFHITNTPVLSEDAVVLFYKTVSFLSIIFPFSLILFSYKYTLLKNHNLSEKWLKYLWAFFSIILLYGILLETYRFIYSEKLPLTYLWALSSILIYWLIYKGLYQFKLSNDQFEIRTILKTSVEKSQIPVINENPHFQKLIVLLEKEKIHHNPNLSRDKVAEELGISSGYLSQVIKKNASLSFSDYINSYRVKDIKKMIKDPSFDKYSLLSIGLECGFNSKTSFYTNFKKETGLTPREFKEQ